MGRYQSFSIALPDAAGAEVVRRHVEPSANVRINHPSGRPWILAKVREEHVVTHEEGGLRFALIGPSSATAEQLGSVARRAQTLGDVPDVARKFSGSFLVFAARENQVYANGPAFHARRIFHSHINGTVVLADRADILADLGEFSLDPGVLAYRLMVGAPYPFSDVPMWTRVHAVPGPQYVIANTTGQITNGTWWRRPAPVLSRAEGAALLREALAAAVAVRTSRAGKVACDLSGGLDSTPLCYFASLDAKGVLARTFYTEDPGGRDDLEWAERALKSMPGVHTHEVFSTEEMPEFYGGLDRMRVPLDEPSQTAVAAPRIEFMLQRDRASGITTHLNGAGGDHLLRSAPMWDHTLFRAKPITAWNRARAEAVGFEVGPLTTLRQLLDRSSYAAWLKQSIRLAAREEDVSIMPRLNDWSMRPSFPSWISQDARQSLRDSLLRDAQSTEPLALNRAEHFDYFNLFEAGRVVRSMGLVGQHHGVNYDAPLIDDHVVEAVLAVRYEERDSPIEWKPLMKAAMRDLLPDEYLRRTNKVGGSPQSLRGYAANYDQLVSVWEESGLFDLGLVDRKTLLRESKPSPTSAPPNTMHILTDVALFLRNLQPTVPDNATDRPVTRGQHHGAA